MIGLPCGEEIVTTR